MFVIEGAALCDRALLEEARHRLGPEATNHLLGITENTWRTWRARPTHRLRLTDRAALLEALARTVPARAASHEPGELESARNAFVHNVGSSRPDMAVILKAARWVLETIESERAAEARAASRTEKKTTGKR